MRVERRDEPRAVSKTGGGGFGVAVSNASAKRGVEKREEMLETTYGVRDDEGEEDVVVELEWIVRQVLV